MKQRLLLGAAATLLLAAACSVWAEGDRIGPHQHEGAGEELTFSQRDPAQEGERAAAAMASKASAREDLFSHPPLPGAFLSKPQDPVTAKKEGNGKKRRKGKGKKRDPCLRKFKDFCFHGECKFIRALRKPSCICQHGYHGERCHALSLPVENPSRSYDNTTILAVTAVVLSSLCLIIIVVLLTLRCHKKGVYDVENEEKVKLGLTGNP